MDPVSVVVGVVPIVFQLFSAVAEGYDMFIEYREFPSSFRELQMALKIERKRLQLWGERMHLSGDQHRQQQRMAEVSHHDVGLWKLFEEILRGMVSALEGATQTMDEYGHLAGAGQQSRRRSSASAGSFGRTTFSSYSTCSSSSLKGQCMTRCKG